MADDNIDKALPNVEQTITVPGEEAVTETEVTEDRIPSPDDIEVTQTDDGGAEINFEPGAVNQAGTESHFDNLADLLPDEVLGDLASTLYENYMQYKQSRKDWEDSYIKGLDLLGFKYENPTQPFQGASGATHPVLAEAVTQFQAQAYKELLPATGPVHTQIMGKPDRAKEEQSVRVKDFMNYQLMDKMKEYEPEFDQMLFYLPLSGSTFKKVYYDELLGRAVSKFVPADDLIVPYTASSLEDAEAVCHTLKMSENDLRKQQVSGFYRDVDIKPGYDQETEVEKKERELEGVTKTRQEDMFSIVECHTDLDLEGFEDIGQDGEPTGIKLPYIVTLEMGSREILSIRRNYKAEDPTRTKIQYFVHFKFLPGLGFYGFGLIHMIGGLSRTATTALRQLLDAGTLSNLPAGFKARGIRIRDDAQPLQPGEFRDIDAPNGNIREGLMPLPYKGPDQVLYQLLGFCVNAGQQFAAVADMQLSEIGASQTPVGTTMALMERGTKVMSAIHKRLHYAQKKEFRLLAKIFKNVLPPVYPFNVSGGPREIKLMDFQDNIDILPVSDPNIFSMSQRVTLAQSELQLAQSNPQMHNLYEAYRRMYLALGVKDIEQILPIPPQPQPMNPAQEHSIVLLGKPLKVFPDQNHELHIKAHRLFISSPVARQNPMVITMLISHINDHVSYLAQRTVDEAMLAEAQKLKEQYGEQIPPEMIQQLEAQRAVAIDNEIVKITEQMVVEEAEAMADVNMDPLVMLKQQELALKAQSLEQNAAESGEQMALRENQFDQKVKMDELKLNAQYDIANLRAGVAQDRNAINEQKIILDAQKNNNENVG